MINDKTITIDEVIQTLNSEFKAKYPHLVQGDYISNFIKFTFNPPECFELLKQEGYKFEENLGNTKQTIFLVKKGNEIFVVFYSNGNSVLIKGDVDRVNNSINKVKKDNNLNTAKSMLILKSGFCTGKETSDSLKNFDTVYTVINGKLQKHDGIPKAFKPIVNLLQKEGYEFVDNLSGTGGQTIFSVKKDNKTFIVNCSKQNDVLYTRHINRLLESINYASENKNGIILVTKKGMIEKCKEGFKEKIITDENGNEYIIYIKDLIISPAEI